MASNLVLAKMAVQISANTAEFNRALSNTQKNLSSFTSGITKIAGTLGVAFGVQQVASFAIEVSKLAGEAEGVRAAFERLPESTKLLNDLKEATSGTVSELGLMKRAVQASNFDISLQALPKLLEFATLRAQQTGQSVDYLVDSIVTGIGRKSKLILDNLGISAVQLDEALGGASTAAASIGEVADAVGRIAEENLKNMAGFSENASTKLQRLSGSWENVKIAIGDAANGTGVLGGAIDSLTKKLDTLSSRDLSFLEKIGSFLSPGGEAQASATIAIEQLRKENEERKKQAQIIQEVDRYFKEFNGDIEAYGKTIETHVYRTELLAEFTKRLVDNNKEHVQTLETLKAKIDELNNSFSTTDANDEAKLQNIGNEIRATQLLIDNLEALKIARLSSTAKKALADENPELSTKTGSDFISDIGVIDAAEQIKQALDDIDTALINNDTSLENWRAAARIKFELYQKSLVDFSGVVTSALSGIGQSLGSAITGSENLGKSLLQVLGGVLSQLGQMLITTGVGIEAFKTSLKSLQGPVAIAAGVALIALGSAVSQGIKNLGSNPTGGGSGLKPSQVFNSNNSNLLGRTPSESTINIKGKISGYDLGIVEQKELYRRNRIG